MQRLHEDDLVGHVLAQEDWEILSFPAIAEADEVHRIETIWGPRCFTRRQGETQWVGSVRFAVFRWPMSSSRTGGASLLGICSDLLEFTRRCLSGRNGRLASVILSVRGRSYNSHAVRR
jgi:hypothetical protein